MRSMNYTRSDSAKLNYPMIDGISSKIGQMIYECGTVFSFFRPDYSPFL